MGVFDTNGNSLVDSDIINLDEITNLSKTSFFGVGSATLGPKKINAYNYFGTDAVLKQKKDTFVNVWLNATVGNDNNDGLTNSTPVATLEKAFDICMLTGNEFRIHITDSSNYSLTARTVTGICIHIVAEANANPTITFNQLAFYNCHINFQGRDATASLTFLCTDESNGWYTDNSFSILKRCHINSIYKQNGGSLDMADCTIHDVKSNYAVVRMSGITFGNSFGRIDSVYLQQGGVLDIAGTMTGAATKICAKMIELNSVFANIHASAGGDLSKFSTGINAITSMILTTSSVINSYGTITVNDGSCVLDGKTFIKP